MPHYVAAARLELDADSDLEAHRRVEAALEALGEPGLVAVDRVDEWVVRSPAGQAAGGGGGEDGWYRTVFEVEVLSRGRFDPAVGREHLNDLQVIADAITDGDCSGEVRRVVAEQVTRKRMRALLLAQRSDPEFLLGNDPDDDAGDRPDPGTRMRNLDALGRLGVADLDRIGPEDQIALVGAALLAAADRPHLWVDAARPSRHAAVRGIWPDGVNPLPCLLVDLAADAADLERIDYHPVSGMTVGAERIPLATADQDSLIELLGLLDD
jgi:hypothetical protein